MTRIHAACCVGGSLFIVSVTIIYVCINDYMFNNYFINRKVVVSGSGYIAVELAGILRGLGSDVTLVIRRGKVFEKKTQ